MSRALTMLPPPPSGETQHPQVAPLFVTAKNSLAVIGQDWQWVLRAATELNVPVVRHGKKLLVPAAKFASALEAAGTTDRVSEIEIDPAEQIRRALGVKKVAR
jgi:hypothetical protein